MSFETTSNKAGPYTGNGVTTSWDYDFLVYAASDLELIETVIATGVETLVDPSLYTVSGLGSESGGAVEYPLTGSPVPGTRKITLRRKVAYEQTTDLRNQGGFFPEVVEKAIDLVAMQVQQLVEELARAFRIPTSDTAGTAVETPAAANRAGKLLGFDADGDLTVSNLTIAQVESGVTSAAASAAAAAASAADAASSEVAAETAQAASEAAQAAAEAAALDAAAEVATHAADTSTHGVGEIVGRTEAQTLTNKTAEALVLSGTTNLSGGQIRFPASQSASADANTLDDYEEGTWTAVLTAATPGDLSVTYAQQSGHYRKIGSVVHILWNVQTTALTYTTASGVWAITGVPFTSLTTFGQTKGSLQIQNWTGAGGTGNTLSWIGASATLINGQVNYSGATIANMGITEIASGSATATIIRGQLTYFTG